MSIESKQKKKPTIPMKIMAFRKKEQNKNMTLQIAKSISVQKGSSLLKMQNQQKTIAVASTMMSRRTDLSTRKQLTTPRV